MPTSRLPHDPFTTASSSTNTTAASATLRPQASQTSLRSNASSASTRTRQQANLFAPPLSRRPPSRTRVEDVLADSESEDRSIAEHRQRLQMRRLRHASPKTTGHRTKTRQQPEEQDIVNRQPDGSYLLGGPTMGVPSVAPMFEEHDQEGNTDELDAYYASTAHRYFLSNAHAGGRLSRQAEDEFERDKADMMLHLRQQLMQKLDDEQWLYEAVDRVHPGM